MKFRNLLILICCAFIALQSCKKNGDLNVNLSNPKLFSEYILAFTAGVISTKDPIDISIPKNWKNWAPNEELDSDLFTITPAVKGKVVYLPTDVIRFIPSERLKQDQRYNITFHLDKVTETEDALKNFSFMVMTVPQTFHTQLLDLQSVSDTEYVLNGVLTTSDWLTTADAKKVLTAVQEKKNLDLKFDSDDKTEAKEFKFTINKIKRTPSESSIDIVINGKPVNNAAKSTEVHTVPQQNYFDHFKVEPVADDAQAFWINFSNPLKKNQDFNGLIDLENNDAKLTFSTDGNVLKVFADKPLQDKINIRISSGIEDNKGNKTLTTEVVELNFGIPKPDVQLINSGTILPSSENLKINFRATTLKAVDVKVYKIYENNILQFLQENNIDGKYSLNRVADPIAKTTIKLTNANPKALMQYNTYALDLSTLISPDPGAIYRVEFSFDRSYSLYGCAESQDSETTDEDIDEDIDEELNQDDEYYDDDYYYYYNWSEKDDPCSQSYYYYHEKAATNVLATDLGVIIKGGNNNIYTTIVTNLITTDPVAAATVEFYTYRQQLITSAKTDTNGILIVNLEKKKPAFAIIKDDRNTTYVKIDEANSLSMSNYDVDGTTLQKGINGYIYTERGVWRPGDNIYLDFILDDLANPLPANHPIKLTFSDPYGKVVDQIVQKKNANNHYAYVLKTNPESLTGNWQAVVSVGGAKFYKQIKIETIKPNRLKIKNTIEGKTVYSNSNSARVDYNVQWLQGSVAKNLKAEVTLKLLPQTTTFSNYKTYSFSNSLSSYGSQEINAFSGSTDFEGDFSFSVNLNNIPENTGMLKAIFTSKVYENGGDVSTDVSTATISPYNTYVGIKAPDANKYGYYQTDEPLKFSFVTVNAQGAPKPHDINVTVYRKKGYWWWSSNNNGASSYSSSDYYSVYKDAVDYTTSSNGTATMSLTIPEQDWGTYEIVARDKYGKHIASSVVYVDYPYWSGKTKHSQGKEATVLALATDKKDYNTGEKIKLSFPSSEGGRALISIENGSTVLETHWVKTQKGETTFEIATTEAMSPNVYINVSAIQPHASTLNNSPIRMYGVAPINVYNKKTKLEPVLTMPDKLKPEQEFTVQVKEKAGQKMTYTIAIVEDGLLDLTRFKTPNPWDNFYSKTALGVRTWDIYDNVIGAYGGAINQVFSIGGDEDLGAGQVKKANRFKPVVIHLGPFVLDGGKTGTHKVKLPKYIGSVRTMVVASNVATKAYGSVEKTVKVNNPLMILGSLPRRAVPGEKVTLPITVFAMESHVKNVTVKVKTDDKFKIQNNATQEITFSEPDEKVVYCDLEVQQKTGISKIEIEAISGKERATYVVELDVLNPNPITVKTEDIVLEPNSTNKIEWEKFGVTGSNKATLELSTFPGINLTSRLNFLIKYPHGCSEQVTSGVFPQIFLEDLVYVSKSKKESLQRNINEGLKTLAQRQMADGSFRYWSSDSYSDDWTTSYILHFLIEAEKRGYALPIGSKANAIAYQQKAVRSWSYSSRYNNDIAQAYRLYTLALAGNADLASMNRLRETTGISADTKLRLAAAYALAGQKEAANKLIASSPIIENNQSQYYYYGSYERRLAMALETLILTKSNNKLMHEYANTLAKRLGSNTWMSTQSTAFGLNVISAYVKNNKSKEGINVDFTNNGTTTNATTKNNMYEYDFKTISSTNEVSLVNKNTSTVYARVAYSGILPVGKELTDESNISIRTSFRDASQQVINPTQLSQGTEFSAYITITNTTVNSIDNVALTQIIPSGWEIVNLRYTDASEVSNPVQHTDIRDDRSNFYFSLNPRETKTLRVVLNASYLGKYYMPGVYAEAMYDNSYRCRTAGQWIEVVK
ncbi:hypothetical protein HX091_05000 [Myroides odoratimimus]|uniref:alpha-2-macroglobulin family protein n=1 Tax=Myroides odoratimimus TaxID=76832 RepID=UPI002576D2C3|nr:MG2 domain-containing protein [Myroides odoratimimus]MDM1525305.1 hypothetical protein [Myroides odoratimimus]